MLFQASTITLFDKSPVLLCAAASGVCLDSRHPDHRRAWKGGSEPHFLIPLPPDPPDPPQREAAEGRPPLWRRPKAASFVLALNTGHILLLRRKTCALLRAKTSALLRRKTCAVLRARTCALFRANGHGLALQLLVFNMCTVERNWAKVTGQQGTET